MQPLPAHQSLDGTTRNRSALAPKLMPDLVSPIDLKVGTPDALNLRHQHCIALGTGATLLRIAPPSRGLFFWTLILQIDRRSGNQFTSCEHGRNKAPAFAQLGHHDRRDMQDRRQDQQVKAV